MSPLTKWAYFAVQKKEKKKNYIFCFLELLLNHFILSSLFKPYTFEKYEMHFLHFQGIIKFLNYTLGDVILSFLSSCWLGCFPLRMNGCQNPFSWTSWMYRKKIISLGKFILALKKRKEKEQEKFSFYYPCTLHFDTWSLYLIKLHFCCLKACVWSCDK